MGDKDCKTTVVFWGPNGSDGDSWITTVPKADSEIPGTVTFDWDGTAYRVPLSSIKFIKPATA